MELFGDEVSKVHCNTQSHHLPAVDVRQVSTPELFTHIEKREHSGRFAGSMACPAECLKHNLARLWFRPLRPEKMRHMDARNDDVPVERPSASHRKPRGSKIGWVAPRIAPLRECRRCGWWEGRRENEGLSYPPSWLWESHRLPGHFLTCRERRLAQTMPKFLSVKNYLNQLFGLHSFLKAQKKKNHN